MSGVSIRQLRKVYPNGHVAIDSLDLDIGNGEFLVLLGPSGCGKSTTLFTIAGLEEPTAGQIQFDGEPVEHLPPHMRDVAVVFQSYALYPHMTVYDNMAFGLKMRKTPKPEIDRRVKEMAETLGISDYLKRKPRQLSGGQRQRVALGRALVRRPKVFLLDEPLSNLDAKLRMQMRLEINKLHTTFGITFVYVTHDQVEAMSLGDRIVVMDKGRIQQLGAARDLYTRPATRFVGAFIGSPSMNFVHGRVRNENGRYVFYGEGCRVYLKNAFVPKALGADVVMAVRPEDVRLSADRHGEDGAGVLRGAIDIIEDLGPEKHIVVRLDERTFLVRADSGSTPVSGAPVTLTLPGQKLHWFCADDGARLSTPFDERGDAAMKPVLQATNQA